MYELIKYLYLSGCLSFLCKLHSFNVYRILSDTYNLFERLRSLISRRLFLDKRYVCITVWITKSVKFGSSSRILFFFCSSYISIVCKCRILICLKCQAIWQGILLQPNITLLVVQAVHQFLKLSGSNCVCLGSRSQRHLNYYFDLHIWQISVCPSASGWKKNPCGWSYQKMCV